MKKHWQSKYWRKETEQCRSSGKTRAQFLSGEAWLDQACTAGRHRISKGWNGGLDILPSMWRVHSYIAVRPVQYQIHNDFFNQFFDIFLEESSKLDQLKEQQPRGKRKTTLEYISLPTFEECRRWLRKNVDMMTKLVCHIWAVVQDTWLTDMSFVWSTMYAKATAKWILSGEGNEVVQFLCDYPTNAPWKVTFS